MQAVRVSTQSIGQPAVEGLTVCDGELYGISISFSEHKSRLIKINKETGVGTPVAPAGSFNVVLMGLAYDPVAQKFYGAGVPWGGGGPDPVNESNLYEIDRNTGVTTKIGDLGTPHHSLAWHPTLGLIGGLHRLNKINTTTGAATPVDASAEFAHDGNPKNGIYGLASEVGDIAPPAGVPVKITKVANAPDPLNVAITFTSEPGQPYEVQVSTNLDFFGRLFDAVGAAASTETTVEANTAGLLFRYYRIAHKN